MIEQEARLLRLQLSGGKSCEVKHTPKPVTPIRESGVRLQPTASLD